ncbi:mitogen-activated protein kinase kinase 3 [Fagus crenata]
MFERNYGFRCEKRQQLLTEIWTLCEVPCYQGLIEFHGACYIPDSGQISIALEYMDVGSLADILRLHKRIPEPVLSSIFQKLLHGLSYLHGVRHLVHRYIKPANLLVNLKGEPKITDFGISAGLENSMAMCATFVGTVTYISPERNQNESYSYLVDIWSLGLALFECGTGEFPYSANEGPVNLMLQKDADARPTAEQQLSHSFIKKYEHSRVDLAAFVQSVFDPTQKMKDLSDVSSLIAELASAATAEEKGLVFEEAMEDRLCAYSRAVAHFPTTVKEFKWRNSWFYSFSEKATVQGKPDPCPLHTA